jgi:uncharacterized membrane protein SpoIIM required for sporulation
VNVHEFIRSNQQKWKELEEFVQQAGRLALPRVPLDAFQRGSLAYRQSIADLAYARMQFPDHPVVARLEGLLGQAHSAIYQARRGDRKSWRRFWTHTWPALVWRHRTAIAASTVVFWAAGGLGLGLAVAFPQLEGLFISPEMRETMNEGKLWTQDITRVAPQATSAITTNNISVTLLAWALGATFGVGTLWLLVTNGLMLGAVFAACMRAGLDRELAAFVVAHGALELPAIWIAAGAGLALAQAMIFPGRFSRGVEIRRAARESALLAIGTLPMLLIAGFVEGFVSPSKLSGGFKAALGAALAAAYLSYVLAGAMNRRYSVEPAFGSDSAMIS